jgi:P27 family predicted phage terminase small subunit
MGRKIESIEVQLAKGKSSITKAEIADRRAKEEAAKGDGVVSPPEWLDEELASQFLELANELKKLNYFGVYDVDTLAFYLQARKEYLEIVQAQKGMSPAEGGWENKNYKAMLQAKDIAFKQMRALAGDLGLTLDSRMKIVAPTVEKKKNKFAR